MVCRLQGRDCRGRLPGAGGRADAKGSTYAAPDTVSVMTPVVVLRFKRPRSLNNGARTLRPYRGNLFLRLIQGF